MKLPTIGVLAFCIALSAALTPGDLAWGQGGAGPVGHPQGGGQLPQDEDTLTTGIVASTTHTQAAATLCTTTICEILTGSAGDGVMLRQCTQAPMRQMMVNRTGAAIQIYGSGTDTINDAATGTGVSLPAISTLGTGVNEAVCTRGGTAAKWYFQ